MRSNNLSVSFLAATLGLSLVSADHAVAADPWPQHAVNLIVPIGSGSGPDIAARIYAEQLAARCREPNRCGGPDRSDGFRRNAGRSHAALFTRGTDQRLSVHSGKDRLRSCA